MSRAKWILLIILIVIVAIQLYRPAMTNPPVDASRTVQATAQVPPQVDAILRRSCYDCHSHETRWPWYTKIAPTSWLLASDVNEGRQEANFSNWAAFDKPHAAKKLDRICKEVQGGDMPPWYYLPMHQTAKLSDADRQTLCNWAQGEEARISAGLTPTERAASAKAELEHD
jgi:cytochrome c551/c552